MEVGVLARVHAEGAQLEEQLHRKEAREDEVEPAEHLVRVRVRVRLRVRIRVRVTVAPPARRQALPPATVRGAGHRSHAHERWLRARAAAQPATAAAAAPAKAPAAEAAAQPAAAPDLG